MELFYVLFLLIILIFLGLLFWIKKIVELFRRRNLKKAKLNLAILVSTTLIICWELRLIPLAKDIDFRNQTEELTGKQFWCRNEYRYEEFGVRGEGFTFEIYRLNNDISKYFKNPDKDFFKHFPNDKFQTTKWKETSYLGVADLNYFTPSYANWSQDLQLEMEEKQKLVWKVANDKNSYFAIRQFHGRDLYIISPTYKVIIYINHNS